MQNREHIALFIDSDNISHRALEGIINELTKYGVVNIRQAYGNWTKDNLKNWEEKLLEFA
ncbi:MAG TPA: NYN domain-containing protein, partial [Campylobacterales bacterium]|nr:NYN domain-containing protein [Campylobacterales bacterium]